MRAATAESTGGGGGEGKAKFQDLHFGMQMSKASPKLMSACATNVSATGNFCASRCSCQYWTCT